MKRVPMPPDVNEQVVFCKRSMQEAWPGFDEEAFRRDIGAANQTMDAIEELERINNRNEFVVNIAMGFVVVVLLILLVSGNL